MSTSAIAGYGRDVKAMPRVHRLASHFAGKPVTGLGMDTDADEADARLAVERMGLWYPTTTAQNLPEPRAVEA